MHWFIQGVKKTFVFSGRASRKEFWYTQIGLVICAVIFFVLANIAACINIAHGPCPISDGIRTICIFVLVGFAFLITCALAVEIRRLHDLGRSGRWIFIFELCPLLLVTFCILTYLSVQSGIDMPDQLMMGIIFAHHICAFILFPVFLITFSRKGKPSSGRSCASHIPSAEDGNFLPEEPFPDDFLHDTRPPPPPM